MRHTRLWVCSLLIAAYAASAHAASPFIRTTSNSDASLTAASTGIAPGGSIDLAVRFKLQEGWHIYWVNGGESGKAPTFNWRLPEGWKVAPMQFPPPQRRFDQGVGHTFILEGEPVLLTTLTAPASAKPGTTASISVEVDWLACKELCVPNKKVLSISVPVVQSPGQVTAANETLFRAAKAALPLPAEQAKYIKVATLASVDRVRPGSAFKIAVVLDIPAEYHLNSHEPLSEFLIGTDLFNEPADGLTIDQPVFPPGVVQPAREGMEPLSLYRGRTIITLPVQADPKLAGDRVHLAGVLTYQTCSDRTGQCYAPTAAQWSIDLPVAKEGETVAATHADVFAAAARVAATSSKPAPAAVASEAKPESIATRPSDDANVSGSSDAGEGAVGVMSRLRRIQDALASYGVLGYLLMAVIGGFLLNLMPCVLPVISIKILSFVQQAKESRVRVLALGTSFAAGILLSFVGLGIFVVLFGRQWGGLFQYPQAVIALAAVVTAFALSLFGVFTLNAPRFVGDVGERAPKEGLAGAFCMGLLATALGTACTAPFLGFVIAIASQQPTIIGMAIFLAAGVGMALPYVLLAVHPAWLRVVPRPGPWINIFEEVMGFVLMGTVIWLLNTVFAQIGGQGLVWTLVFLLFVSTAAWLYGKVAFDASAVHRWTHYVACFLIIGVGWVVCFRIGSNIDQLLRAQREQWLSSGAANMPATNPALAEQSPASAAPNWEREIPWIPYTPARARQAVESGRTVFVDYTAEWCANCKANEKLVINTAPIREAMARMGVVPFRANYTWRDPEIKADLDRYHRGGVPMYLVIPAGRPGDGFVLDELLTKASVLAALEKAGPSVAEARPSLQSSREQPARREPPPTPVRQPQPLGASQ